MVFFSNKDLFFAHPIEQQTSSFAMVFFFIIKLHRKFTGASCCFPADCRAATDFLQLISPLLGFIVLRFDEELLQMHPELEVIWLNPQSREEMILQWRSLPASKLKAVKVQLQFNYFVVSIIWNQNVYFKINSFFKVTWFSIVAKIFGFFCRVWKGHSYFVQGFF